VLPYVEQPVLDLGFYRVEAFLVLVAASIVVEFQIVMRRAPKRGIDRATASALLGWAILLGIVGAHVFDEIAYRPQRLLTDPLALLRPWEGISSFGGMLGGLLGLYAVMRHRRMSGSDMLRFVDCLLFALPFTLAVGRLGCALQHDHLGASSTHWLAVAFPDGPRFDLGLLELFYVSILALVFLLLDRRRWPDGFFIGAFFLLYGPVRFVLDGLRVSEPRYFGWTPGQYAALLAVAVGAALILAVMRRAGPAALSSP
jgi:phosphatidylglycerol:prolipoprotein diacylglycerol transferase